MAFSTAQAFLIPASAPNPAVMKAPLPTATIYSFQMPQRVVEEPLTVEIDGNVAVATYHEIKRSFCFSTKAMSDFLGVKRRSMYNWLSDPDRASIVGPQIEARLANLKVLQEDMEPEHYPLLSKMAFSPILGDKRFGEALLAGASSSELVEWYDRLYSKFESYRKISLAKYA
jgi:hypothetical protein